MRIDQLELLKKLIDFAKENNAPQELIKKCEDEFLGYTDICIKCKNYVAEWGDNGKGGFNWCSSCFNE